MCLLWERVEPAVCSAAGFWLAACGTNRSVLLRAQSGGGPVQQFLPAALLPLTFAGALASENFLLHPSEMGREGLIVRNPTFKPALPASQGKS